MSYVIFGEFFELKKKKIKRGGYSLRNNVRVHTKQLYGIGAKIGKKAFFIQRTKLRQLANKKTQVTKN